MRWWRKMLALFGRTRPSPEGAAAVAAADASHRIAVERREQMALLRAEADVLAAEVRAHNKSNHFDSWLQEVIRQNMR